MSSATRERLSPEVFRLPVERIRAGYYSDAYFNANANRLNRLATRLTVLASFFLVWSFVSSFFGQNFGWLTDHIDSLASFVIWMTVGLVIPSVLLAIYFWRRRREWL